MVNSLEAGATLPPILIDKKSFRIVDGLHRVKAVKRFYGKNGKITAILKDYKSDIDLFIDAMQLNAGHGRTLTKYDQAHCIIKADELNIPKENIATALNLTMDKLGKLTKMRIAKVATLVIKPTKIKTGKKGTKQIPLKRSLGHMKGKILTQGQAIVNEKSGGMPQSFTTNELIMMLEQNLIDTDNLKLMAQLEHLYELLDNFLNPQPKKKTA